MENGLVTRVELLGQLSSPSLALKRLLKSWRQLPAASVPARPPVQRRTPQRAEGRLGPDGVARLVADYQAGQASTSLARSYGLSKATVLRLLEANGVARRQQSLTAEQQAEAVQLYLGGWSLARVGEHFGRDHSVIFHVLKRAGVERRDSHGRS